MRFIVSYLLGPAIIGLVIGMGVILSKPEIRYSVGQQLATFLLPKSYRPVSYAIAVSKAAPAVVNISTRKRVNLPRNPLYDDPLFRHFFNSADVPKQQKMSSALGSGVIINPQGYLLTNYHVIADAEEIFVTLYDGRNLRATVVGADKETDLAVLKIPTENIRTITLGEPQQSLIGDVVLAIGNPFNIGQTVTQGIISATGRHGLGLNVVAVNIMNDIITNGEAIRGWLGIEARTVNTDIIRSYNLGNVNGVLITSAYPNGPADKAGLRKGDILTHINDKPVGNGREGMNLIAEVQPNDKVQITALRNGEKLLLTAIAAKRPKEL